jgi:hypothetical protein
MDLLVRRMWGEPSIQQRGTSTAEGRRPALVIVRRSRVERRERTEAVKASLS